MKTQTDLSNEAETAVKAYVAHRARFFNKQTGVASVDLDSKKTASMRKTALDACRAAGESMDDVVDRLGLR